MDAWLELGEYGGGTGAGEPPLLRADASPEGRKEGRKEVKASLLLMSHDPQRKAGRPADNK